MGRCCVLRRQRRADAENFFVKLILDVVCASYGMKMAGEARLAEEKAVARRARPTGRRTVHCFVPVIELRQRERFVGGPAIAH
jgi:hypothetical protein